MEFYGLLGEKLSHSISPKIHKLILDYIKEDGAYKLFEVKREDLTKFTESLKVLKIKGANVTIPYKEEIMESLDLISIEAKRIGAINTISLVNDKLYGYNTDYYGFGYMLEAHDVEIKDKKAVILGNGGACKAALYYLLDKGIEEVLIVSRRKLSKNYFNDDKVKVINYDELPSVKGDILINSTPIGMYPNIDDSPVNKEIVSNFDTLVDLIYNPLETNFMKLGIEEGKKTIGGLYMLVGQAVKAQEIWNNKIIDKEIVEKIYKEVKKDFI